LAKLKLKMMILKKCYYLLCLITISAIGQKPVFQLSGYGSVYTTADVVDREAGVEGSAYLNNKYQFAQISCFSGKIPPLRYNALRDEMEYQVENKKYYMVKIDSCEVMLDNKLYKYLQYQGAEGVEKRYLVLLSDENNRKIALYKKEKMNLIPEVVPKSSYHEAKPAHYELEQGKYYLSLQNKTIVMPRREKDVLALFPEKANEIKAFIKEKNISLRDEKDIIDLVRFLNSLK
jgi:hypothetical protein